ncbi:MAG: DUF4982 domain-containing protein [Bacteroidales bacterium]|nr:DUF4982 domain-containing protein [Bacteroidales bacterium]
MNKFKINITGTIVLSFLLICSCSKPETRILTDFCNNWKFSTGDFKEAHLKEFPDVSWRTVTLPHDWSIEGEFSNDHPATPGGGALPGGVGWYRKYFSLSEEEKDKLVFIDFDGVYMDSKVWINGYFLGRRPYGYISFRYDLSPYLNYGDSVNVIAVRVDNSMQPNSRWYSGSGIYRNVRLVTTNKVYIDHWGTYISTPEVSEKSATISVQTKIRNATDTDQNVTLKTFIINKSGKKVVSGVTDTIIGPNSTLPVEQNMRLFYPELWSIENSVLYTAISQVEVKNKIIDEYLTNFGIRFFEFDVERGFFLNGEHIKIKGVCNHHDLGCLGAATNVRAMERQLEILKEMGCNAIRTAHNPPAPELLDLCDKIGFIVMDEAFDMWKLKKTEYDYSRFWDEWHKRDLLDFMKRDRNHPSIFIWSLGNEIMEQWDTSGIQMVQDLYKLARTADSTRPITTANNPPGPFNNLTKPMVIDLIGYNYHHNEYKDFLHKFPGEKFIGAETASALATRGHYSMPSDTIKRWPYRWDIPFTDGEPDNTVSAYDHISAPWGSTQEEVWRIIKKYDFLSGMYIWTGFDYLGEPTPYGWPSRSSYFGIIDLAGFPKDTYYLYKSEWTDEPVLHVFPHWNWNAGDTIDVWAYFNCDEVELFLNDKSQGTKRKEGDNLHVVWRLPFKPGTLKAIGRSNGKTVLEQIIKTAGEPAKFLLTVDRKSIRADGKDLSFVTVDILDAEGNLVPRADNLVHFDIEGNGFIAGVDNGSQTSHESFKTNYRKAFNGKCLAVIQSSGKPGKILLKVKSEGLEDAAVTIHTR